jgi:hypothetical protein
MFFDLIELNGDKSKNETLGVVKAEDIQHNWHRGVA